MTQSGQLFALPTLAPHIDVSDASFSLWTTIRAEEGSGYRSDGSLMLKGEAVEWQTPATFQGKRRRQVNQTERNELLLPGQAEQWATPTGRDHKDGANPSENVATNSLLGRQAPRTPMPGQESSQQTRRLNPRFVEMLMGWEIGWTDFVS